MSQDSTTVKTRFAPSPTGLLHLGNVRTALFNALFAYRHGGVFLLRIEDTDAERSRPEYTEHLMQDLRWLGLDWQEGPEAGGAQGPYYQSRRGEIYARYYAQLQAQEQVYPCFCSPAELEMSRKLQRAAGQAPRYAGTCAHLGPAEAQARLARGAQPTLRFRVPRGEQVIFDDLVRGEQRFAGDDIGDFIIRRADGTPAFFFCNAVDDALMGVSHALRGEDHLTNTPRQLLLLRALGLPAPRYGHISIILGPDGTPLSKRNGSQSLQELREGGWLAQGVANYLARLGHSYAEDRLMSLDELAERFSLERLGRAPARFDPQQMQYWQQSAVAGGGADTLWAWLGEGVRARVPAAELGAFLDAVRPNVLFPSDAAQWAEILFGEACPVRDEAEAEIRGAGAEFFRQALAALENQGTDWAQLTQSLKQSSGRKGKALFMPLRAALTGMLHGPEMAKLLPLLGLERAGARLRRWAETDYTATCRKLNF